MIHKVETVAPLHAKIVAVGECDLTVYYVVQVQHGSRAYFVAKRYSEFHGLWKQLAHAQHSHRMSDACILCQHLPRFPKKLLFSTKGARQRRFEDLQQFLRATLMAIQGDLCDEREMCAGATALVTFLSVHDKTNQAPTMYDSVQLDAIHPDAWYRARADTEVMSSNSSSSGNSHRSSIDSYDLAFYSTTPAATTAPTF
ncbi:hypothetical protein ACHHYP_01395 [Achlya hypogyna]|uniref:PX domain-containing protein n=1 Tax=Achlya hypogyna TaxID=1202772 RepID=A0A1V9Z8P7_ACHHY|nr:hypothetical protein ACHHYP_01395 [Achlya hypogyna]